MENDFYEAQPRRQAWLEAESALISISSTHPQPDMQGNSWKYAKIAFSHW